MQESIKTPSGKGWDKYWHGTSNAGAFSSGGVNHPSIDGFWTNLFDDIKVEYESPKIVDIATGNGAVVEIGLTVLGNAKSAYTCIDVSDSAIDNVLRRFPGVTGIVADAASIPLQDRQFDIANQPVRG